MAKTRRPLPPMVPQKGNTVADKKALLTAVDLKALPILRSSKKESDLVKWVMERMAMADDERNRRADRCQEIDVQLSGFIALDAEDRKRDQDNKGGKVPKPTKHNIPLAQAQINQCVTYLMSVFAPEKSIFTSVAPADKQQEAQALTGQINRDGQRGAYYRQMVKFCKAAIKYNFGGMTCYFEEYQGIIFKSHAGQAKKTTGTIWQGNVLTAINNYNFFYDTSVHPCDLPTRGEFFAEVERITPFRARKMFEDKQLFGIDRFIKENFAAGNNPTSGTNAVGSSYYRVPPSVRTPSAGNGSTPTDWRSVFRGGDVQESAPGLEVIRFTTWLRPSEHGLSSDDELQLWRLRIVNGRYLSYAARLEDSHGMLPVVIAAPLEDDLENEQRTYPEQLLPLQHFSSFLLNSHQDATRKAIGGITVYNPHLIAGLDLSRDDLIGARIPIRSTATDFDIDKAFRHFDTAPNTQHHVDMLPKIDAIMQKILPTDTLRQVADLERATLYQAAATVQAGDRTNFTLACIIDDQALTPLKYQIIYNIYAKLTQLSFIDDATGTRQDIPIGNFIDKEVEHDVGVGIKGLDRLMTIQILRDVLNAVIQSRQAIQEIDIVKFLNYFSTLAGDRTDLTQFRRTAANPAPQVPPSQAPIGLPGGGPTQ